MPAGFSPIDTLPRVQSFIKPELSDIILTLESRERVFQFFFEENELFSSFLE